MGPTTTEGGDGEAPTGPEQQTTINQYTCPALPCLVMPNRALPSPALLCPAVPWWQPGGDLVATWWQHGGNQVDIWWRSGGPSGGQAASGNGVEARMHILRIELQPPQKIEHWLVS